MRRFLRAQTDITGLVKAVGILARGAADDIQRRVRECGGIPKQRLGDVGFRPLAAHDLCVLALGGCSLSELLQRKLGLLGHGVSLPLYKVFIIRAQRSKQFNISRLLAGTQSVQNGHFRSGTHRAGAGADHDLIRLRLAEHCDLCAACKRQNTVVLRKNDALFRDFLRQSKMFGRPRCKASALTERTNRQIICPLPIFSHSASSSSVCADSPSPAALFVFRFSFCFRIPR